MTPGRRRLPAPDTTRTALGTCTGCGARAYGHFVGTRKARIVLVEHCTGDEPARRDPPQLTAAAAVSVAAVVLVCVLLLTIWR
ncbi:hypothetical protein [Kitasatospora purpeofusca]|uniref:hypothetical protein n=1 Tax=Kitasatospora purpeofusca TaxID=67352 RepID=UPI0022517F58|nr:hypothetical protein [Kitasatospora purpeofusca]MCX4752877.1 hypothetical protein [Kitasatospora purpeofusca]WSR32421.1 hypothetical protein OG715_16395 [Kitasatospora purpeofusca]